MTDDAALNKELDKVKSQVFLGTNAAFFGSIMCTLNFSWTKNIPTAGTNGIELIWNPDFFKELPVKTRKTVLLHELHHAARLHHVRRGNRDPKIWNYACDIRINNDLETSGETFEKIEWCWKDQSIDMNDIMAEEQIYDYLVKNAIPIPASGAFGRDDGGDMTEMPSDQKQIAVNNVVRAIQQAKAAGGAGNIPGGLEEMVNKFLAPIIPWERALMEFFTSMMEEDYSWRRPNRRYQDMYLPSLMEIDEGRLDHLIYYLDVSGSISEAEIVRFNSEVKFIQETLKPKRLTLVEFDTRIQYQKDFEEGDPFNEIKVIGRGGTSLECVKAHIERHNPTAVVIFSDLLCRPMEKPKNNVPILWVVVNSLREPNFGKMIRIKV